MQRMGEWSGRERSKKEEEGTRIETGEEQERMTADQIIEERRTRETEEREEYDT